VLPPSLLDDSGLAAVELPSLLDSEEDDDSVVGSTLVEVSATVSLPDELLEDESTAVGSTAVSPDEVSALPLLVSCGVDVLSSPQAVAARQAPPSTPPRT
jgi:hypothetical protein